MKNYIANKKFFVHVDGQLVKNMFVVSDSKMANVW